MRRLLIVVFVVLVLSSCAGVNRGPSGMGEKASSVVNDSRGPYGDSFKPGPQFSAELRERIALQLKEMEGNGQNVPITLNDDVQRSVEFFLTDARKFMIRSLGRSTKYKTMMQNILLEKGLPPDLVYLVLIESGFRADAVSPAAAGGPWQFIASTGKRYGLQIDDWVDERMDPVKATYAAADYLADLHEMFGCWYLSAAAYNAGEGKILKALKKYQANDFWEIAQEDYLRDETKDYVPRLLAAILIAKDPARYGLTEIDYDDPLDYDEVVVTEPTDLDVVGNLVGVDEDSIKDLNPQLKLWCTPLNRKNFRIRVPKGTGDTFYKAYALLPPKERLKLSVHKVAKGESLKSIASLYGMSASTLKRFNGLRSTKLKTGQIIKLPVDAQEYQAKRQANESKVAARLQQIEKSGNKVTYTVKSGDTPFSIASNFDVNWKDVASWNNIQDVRKMMPGTKLVLYLEGDKTGTKSAGKKTEGRIVATNSSKDTADKTSQSRKSGTKDKASASEANTTLTAGNKYTVQEGDSVWKIAIRFKVRPEDLRRFNNLKGNRIRPGQVITLAYSSKASADTAEQTETAKKTPAAADTKADSSEPEVVAVASAEPSQVKATKTSATGFGGTYSVQKEDTVWKISQKFNCRPDDIKAANGLKDYSIKPGQVIKVPGGTGNVKAQATSGDKTKTKSSAKATTSGGSKAASGNGDKSRAYKVKNGDTVWKIARLFKVEPAQIRSWNAMENDHLRPGDVLTIKDENS